LLVAAVKAIEKMLIFIFGLLIGSILKAIRYLVRKKFEDWFVSLIRYRSSIRDLCHLTGGDLNMVLEFEFLYDAKFEPYWMKKQIGMVWSLKQDYLKSLKFLGVKLITQKQELEFRKGRFINHRSVNYVNTFLEQVSAYFSFPDHLSAAFPQNPIYSVTLISGRNMLAAK
jgi:hypothetical protein